MRRSLSLNRVILKKLTIIQKLLVYENEQIVNLFIHNHPYECLSFPSINVACYLMKKFQEDYHNFFACMAALHTKK